jgi:hypothetical protein
VVAWESLITFGTSQPVISESKGPLHRFTRNVFVHPPPQEKHENCLIWILEKTRNSCWYFCDAIFNKLNIRLTNLTSDFENVYFLGMIQINDISLHEVTLDIPRTFSSFLLIQVNYSSIRIFSVFLCHKWLTTGSCSVPVNENMSREVWVTKTWQWVAETEYPYVTPPLSIPASAGMCFINIQLHLQMRSIWSRVRQIMIPPTTQLPHPLALHADWKCYWKK